MRRRREGDTRQKEKVKRQRMDCEGMPDDRKQMTDDRKTKFPLPSGERRKVRGSLRLRKCSRRDNGYQIADDEEEGMRGHEKAKRRLYKAKDGR